MPDLAQQRQAIRHLLNENNPADAMASYFALYHPDAKTQLFLYPPEARTATGYLARSKTGIDLFRPLITLRLPPQDFEGSAALLAQALAPGAGVILSAPVIYEPLLRALFDVQKKDRLCVYALDPQRFQPEINVLVTRTT